MGAPSKRARKIRSKPEFESQLLRLISELRAPRDSVDTYSWSLERIVAARRDQMMGRFRYAAKLSESMKTDDAIKVAYDGRLAPQKIIPVSLEPRPGARGKSIADEARSLFGNGGIALRPNTLTDINGCLVEHGVAFATNVMTPRPDGSRVDIEVKYWPIEYVRWDPIDRCFKAQVDPMGQRAVIPKPVVVVGGERQAYQSINVWEEPIVHGDGRWVIFQEHQHKPFIHGALNSSCLVWARNAFAKRDWAKSSVAHGNAKVIGELPAGMVLQNANGKTPEAAAFLELLQMIGESDLPVGIRPAGSKTDFITNSSNAWQVFSELVANAERAAARIYLGTDGILGAQGGAPGVNVEALFGVATTRVHGDLKTIEHGIQTGSIEPWTALNFGDSSLAPRRCYMLPDAQSRPLSTSDVAGGVITVNEARRREGLGPLVDDAGNFDQRGKLTIAEFNAKVAPPKPAAN